MSLEAKINKRPCLIFGEIWYKTRSYFPGNMVPVLLSWPHLLGLISATPNSDPGYRGDPRQGPHSCPFLKVCFIAVSRPKAGQKTEIKSGIKKKRGCTKQQGRELFVGRSGKVSTSSTS